MASGYFEKKGNQIVFCMKGFALDTGSGLSLCETLKLVLYLVAGDIFFFL